MKTKMVSHRSMANEGNKPDSLDPKVKEHFGERVRKRREDLNFDHEGEYTREKVAEHLGISASAVGNIERGISFPSPARLIKLAALLDLSLDKALPRRLVQRKPETAAGGD